MRRAPATGVLLVLLTGACSSSHAPTRRAEVSVTSFEAALQAVKAELAATATGLQAKAERVVPGLDDGPQGCADGVPLADQKAFHQSALVSVRVPEGTEKALLPDVEARWRAQGYTVDTSHLGEVEPQLRAEGQHVRFTATARTGRGNLLLGGETACLPSDGSTP